MRLLLLVLMLALTADAQQRKEVAAVRAVGLKLDGKLDEAAWSAAQPMSGFAQRVPNEGAPATDATEVRFAFDDGSLWIGAWMQASDASRIAAPVTRRDDGSQAEHILVSLDTFLDRRTAWTFGVTAAGTRLDRYHSSDTETSSATFDPVWEAAVDRDAHGWTAELRIPISQLRFTAKEEQRWGVNVKRFVPSRNESDYWIVVPRNEVGWASRFGDLTGIDVQPARRIELLPYVAGTNRMRGSVDVNNPLEEETELDQTAGLDVKAGIGPNLTLDATFNPDFGQVEADPAVINLGAFETVFSERRPFFVEGASIFTGYGPQFFYSRRIGAAPGAGVSRLRREGWYVDAPAATRILGAAKLTGRFSNGTSIGALAAVTDEAVARTFRDDVFGRERVAPRSFFGVFRAQKQFGTNGSTVGLSATGTQRDHGHDDLSSLLHERAVAGGIDWNLRFKGGEYEVTGGLAYSDIAGSPAAIARAQLSPQRYFQRPDADHVEVDPARTSLAGPALIVRVDRLAGKHWLWMLYADAVAPEFEINDAGRLQLADSIYTIAQLRYRETEPRGAVRDYDVGVTSENGANFGGERTWTSLRTDTSITWRNFWTSVFTAWVDFPSFDDRASFGGPLLGRGRGWVLSTTLANSTAARNTWSVRAYRGESDLGERTWDASAKLTVRPRPRWQLSAEPVLFVQTNPRIFAGFRGDDATFAFVDRDEYSLRIRANYALTPDLTFELYTEPFVASGTYYDFGLLKESGARTLVPAAHANGFDYNVRSFRSNAVLRWEWRPGSTAYVVWQQDRFAELAAPSTARPSSLARTLSAPGDNIIAVKFSYWIPL